MSSPRGLWRRERSRGGATAGLLLALGLSAAASSARPAALHDCRLPGIAHSVQCGSVGRPLDPAQPAGPQVTIHYVVVPALARQRRADPVFLLAGGPGQSAITVAPSMLPLLSRLNNRRDLVFVDQRGTGKSTPLDCEDARREPLSDQADAEHIVAAMDRCRSRLVQGALAPLGGANALRFFTTTIAMQDLDAVRRELGASRIDLVGASYGTRAGLEYMRQFPAVVRRSVLDGVVPPDMVLPASASSDAQRAFDAMLDGCEHEAACTKAYPRLRADWAALLGRLPLSVVVVDGITGVPTPWQLTRDALLGAVRGPLYLPALAAALPAAIDAAAHGRYEALAGLSALLSTRKGTELAMGMHFAVVCSEDLPLLATAREPPGADFGDDFARLYARVCAQWPRGAVPAAFYRVPSTTTPTLLLSGGADPAAPPRHAARVAGLLGARARHVVVAHAGHGLMGIGCMRDVIYRFIDADTDEGAMAVDSTCIESIPRPLAFLPIAVGAEAPK